MSMMKNRLIRYLTSLGLTVNTNTKARGHQGFWLKNRIDISKYTPSERIIPTILHEFAHYVHSKIETNIAKTGGSLETIFQCEPNLIFDELWTITNFVDENSKFEKLNYLKSEIKEKILAEDRIIKEKYPKFLRSKKFREFDKYIKNSKAKHLLKYDRVRFYSWFIFSPQIISIKNLEKDFPEIPKEFAAYIRLKSLQRKQKRIANKKNKLKKYYEKPTELFARFVEGLALDELKTKELAPKTYKIFLNLLETDNYKELKIALDIVHDNI